MKKMIALGVAALLSFGAANADDHSQSMTESSHKSPKPHPQTEDSNNLGIYASYLFWQLGSYNTFYQTTCEDAYNAINSQNLYPEAGTNFVRTDAKAKSGFQVGLEFLIDELDKWTFGVQYQWIKHNITTVDGCCNPCEPCNTTCENGWSWWGACCWLGQAQFALANSDSGMDDFGSNDIDVFKQRSFAIDEVQVAKNKTSWQSVDLTFAKAMHAGNSKHISFEPKMGLEFNWFKMETYFNGKFVERNQYTNTSGAVGTYEQDYFQWCMKDKPWAIGPFAGANLALRFDSDDPSTLSLFGNFKVAELYTKHRYTQVYNEDAQNPCDYACNSSCDTSCCDDSCCGNTDGFNTTMLHTNAKIGLGYTHIAEDNDVGFDISVAWELNNFVNFFDSVHAWSWDGDLAYQGLTLTLGVYF